jgi:integrase
VGQRITKRSVDAAKPGKTEYFVWDSELIGFGLRVRPSGVKSYVVKYRAGPGRRAPVRRITLGKHGKLTPDTARDAARRVLADVVLGADPGGNRAHRRREITVRDLAERYVAEHIRMHNKPTTALEFERLVRSRIIPTFGTHRVGDLTRADVKVWHTRMCGAPYAANRALAVLRKMFSLAVKEWQLRDDNPALGIKMFREMRRERFASDEDLARVGRWLANHESSRTLHPSFPLAVRLLALTGMRLGEVLSLEWSMVDFQAGVIRLPDAKAGARAVPLSAAPAALLASLAGQEGRGRFVVLGNNSNSPFARTAFRTGWHHLRVGTGLSDLRPHDLRHTTGTFAAQAGANAFLVRDLLGHKTLAMTSRYVERTADPIRALADQVSNRVAAAMDGQEAKVLSFENGGVGRVRRAG